VRNLILGPIVLIISVSPGLCEELAYAFGNGDPLQLSDSSLSEYNSSEVITFTAASGSDGVGTTYESSRTVDSIRKEIDEKVQVGNPIVISEAREHAKRFPGEYNIEQVCSIYHYIRDNWRYINDPRGMEYYQYANETILKKGNDCSGAGDCDDFAIFMSALIENIGGTTRINLASGSSGGHAYAEVYLGRWDDKDSNNVNRIMRWLRAEYDEDIIYAHVDLDRGVWLNLDWSADHPGGPFYEADKNIKIIIRKGIKKTDVKPANEPPLAITSYEPDEPTARKEMIFDASLSHDPYGRIVYYEWDFGDGNMSSGTVVKHSYSKGGNFIVNLTITDDEGAQDFNSTEISVNKPPTADFTCTPSEPKKDDEITFDASPSKDEDGHVMDYEWDFGDGDISRGRIKTRHKYYDPSSGNFTVKLTVIDDNGAESTRSKIIKVNEPPVAKFNYKPDMPNIGDNINFDASDSSDEDGKIVHYEWDFERGVSDEGVYVTHNYSAGGNFTVKLNVRDDNNATNAISAQIRVNRPPVALFAHEPADPVVKGTTTFNAAGSEDVDGKIVTYKWNFDDGYEAKGISVAHTYSKVGNFNVTLETTDDNGAKNYSTIRVRVKPNAPSIERFEAGTKKIDSGKETTLRWKTSDATSVTIYPGIGRVNLTGQRAVSPSKTTTYKLNALNSAGSVEKTVQILVVDPLALDLAEDSEDLMDRYPNQLTKSILLAVESMKRYPSAKADQALRRGLTLLPSRAAVMSHNDSVNAVVFSSNKKNMLVATASDDGTAKVWDDATGDLVATMFHDDSVVAVAFSPDGTRLATASEDNTARVWKVITGTQLATMSHDGPVNAVAFSPDGTKLATASEDETARFWNADTGEEIFRMAHDKPVNALAFSPGGTRLATASEDKTARIWGTTMGHQLATMPHDDSVLAVAFSPDGTRLATASEDETVRIWNTARGYQLATMPHDDSVVAVAFSPDGAKLATASEDDTAKIWDMATGEELSRMVHDDPVNAVVFSPDGTKLATASEDKTVRVWDITTNKELARMVHELKVNSLGFSPDGAKLATASADNTVKIWNVTKLVVTYCGGATRIWDATTSKEKGVLAVAFSPDGRYLATASEDNTARVWDATTGAEISIMDDHDGQVLAVAFNQDGSYLATGCEDKRARVWNTTTGLMVHELNHEYAVWTVAFSPNGAKLVMAGDSLTIKFWNLTIGEEIFRIEHDKTVNALTFSPDGTKLATANNDGSAKIWNATTGQEITRMDGHDQKINALAFSPGGTKLATAGDDGTAKIWDVATGRELYELNHDNEPIWTVAFSQNGNYLATGSSGKMARVWDMTTGEELSRITHETSVTAVAFSPDGNCLATTCWDGTARMWLWQPEDLIEEACNRLTRNLTPEEWHEYLGDETHCKTCPNLP